MRFVSQRVECASAVGVSRAGRLMLACVLAFALVPAVPSTARAVGVAEAQAALDEAEARMQSIASEHDALQKEVDDLQARIDKTAAQVLESQQGVVEGQTALGKTAVYQYRGGSVESLLTLVLEAEDFDAFLRSMSYLESVLQFQSDEITAQQERVAQFEAIASDLDFQKNEQEKKLAELEEKEAEAEQVVASASSQLQSAQAEEVERLAALQRAAEQLAASQESEQAPIANDANTVDREDVVDPGTPVQPDPKPVAPDSGSNSGGSDSGSSESGWRTGIASAYGGSTDPYTPNPGTTATGAVCDDRSMGVAVPMAWPNYRSYFGRTVEISYNGKTVYATVNDCGGMGGGSRSLDLQPGVWKAFGYSSCTAWGLRTVSYRFL